MVKLGKFIAVMATVFIASTAGLGSTAYAAEKIGIVDLGYLIEQHPDTVAAREGIQTETAKMQKEFDEKEAALSTVKEKEELRKRLQQQLDTTKQQLIATIKDKITVAVQEVAEEKGFTLVVDKGIPVYGGQDITMDVGKKLISK